MGMKREEALRRREATAAAAAAHKHSYRKDGTCACGKVRKTR